ncbi:MAG: tetratricopeptide repeat protein [Planctomycetes bacterium]|nr:tetratricopeptide repeat protein [Planctomycetota bacterium]
MGCPLTRFVPLLVLLAAVAACYAQVGELGFTNWDDDQYLAERPQVRTGLSLANARWAFTATHVGNWHPLTTLSHQLDCSLFGLEPRGPHVENALLHFVVCWLLFSFWHRATGQTWRALAVALLFAVHPLHVESVAWVSERKNLLCALFWLLTMHAWLGYASHGGMFRDALVAICCALALLAKPMAVTLPVALMLVDWWPFRHASNLRTALRGKCLLLALAIAAAVMTLLAQARFGAVQTAELVPWNLRAVNAARSYGIYLWQFLWPRELSCMYPLPGGGDESFALDATWLWQGLASLAVVATFTLVLCFKRRALPAAWMGWGWYLVTLLPVIGLVQVGEQAHADRYMYLPMIGLLVAVVWTWNDWLPRWLASAAMRNGINTTLLVALSAGCIWLTRAQVPVWQDSHTLFTHALAVGRQTDAALFNLGLHEDRLGDWDDAEQFYLRSLKLNPRHTRAMNNLGGIELRRNRPAEALAWFDRAVAAGVEHPLLYINRGEALTRLERWPEAVTDLARAVKASPHDVRALHLLGRSRAAVGQLAAALDALNRAVAEGNPTPELLNDRGAVELTLGHTLAAAQDFRAALTAQPENTGILVNLAEVMTRQGNRNAATAMLEKRRDQLPNDSPQRAAIDAAIARLREAK